VSATETNVDVLIIGGGPVGLTARALLHRWGVSVMLVEKYGGLSPFPRSRLLNVRTMEIYRQLGLDNKITAGAFPPEYGRVRFRDTMGQPDWATAAMVGVNAPIPESPATGAVTSQDRLEPILLTSADAPMHYGVELVDLAQEPDAVVAWLLDHRAGGRTSVRAQYVLACDGANSSVRRLLGIGTTGPGALGSFTTVVCDVDLTRWSADQPAGVYFTANGLIAPVYPEGVWAWFTSTPRDAEHADWPSLVSRAISPELEQPVDVVRVQHWVMNAFVAERLGQGRVHLAGDAAHAIPPIGGLGLNTGVADVHNLCWKLAGVLQGWAGPDLLDSYEAERLPVAHHTLRQTVANSQLTAQAQAARGEQLRNGDTAPARVELPWSERYFAQLGLVLGLSYRSAAVFPDGDVSAEPVDPGTDYLPTARPGHRMPHSWLGPRCSTLDSFGEWFTLLTATPAHWERHDAAPWPVRVVALPEDHAESHGLGKHGAILVRPDGYISARWPNGRPGESAVRDVLAATSGLHGTGPGRP
jgi:2-polyprenyl-6-methoxyphenol hydroxylase-like FAD-dependent oxidoreductase